MKHPIFFGDFGSDLKVGDDGKISGWLVRYGSPSQTDATKNRDYFTYETDFDFSDGDSRSILHEHGFSPVYGGESIGVVKMYKRNLGVWAEGVIKSDLRDRDKLIADIKSGKYGFSSGTQGYRAQRERKSNGAHEIKRWPIGEASLTTDPAEPGGRTRVDCVKSIIECGYSDEMKTSIYIRLEDYDWGEEGSTDTTMSHSVSADSPASLKEKIGEVKGMLDMLMEAMMSGSTKSIQDAEEAYMKMGAKISKTSGKHMTAAHDAICAVYPEACPANAKKTAAKSLVDTVLLDQLADLKLEIKMRDARVVELENEKAELKKLADRDDDAVVTEVKTKLTAAETELAEIKSKLEEAEKQATDLQAQITEKDATIARHEETIKTRLAALSMSATTNRK